MVYRLILSYRGGGYAGWQRQPNAMAVQQAVEEAVAELTGESVPVVGASRTDAGVHARGQSAHLELSREWPLQALVHGVNHHLPEGIRILEAHRMADGFHARKSAVSKEYRYRLIRGSVLAPLDAPYAWRVEPGLDVDVLRQGAAALLGRPDFSGFALAGGAHRDPHRTVLEAEWVERGPELTFRIVGDGFLRGMVRSLVGTLVELGRGKRSLGSFVSLLGGGERGDAGPTAPPQGLVLERVHYGPEWPP